jgi:hypothetical protein
MLTNTNTNNFHNATVRHYVSVKTENNGLVGGFFSTGAEEALISWDLPVLFCTARSMSDLPTGFIVGNWNGGLVVAECDAEGLEAQVLHMVRVLA